MGAKSGGGNALSPLFEVPVIQLSSSVVFPNDVVSIQITDSDLGAEILRDPREDLRVALVFGRKGLLRPRRRDDLHSTCILCRVMQCVELPGGALQAVFHGLRRAEVAAFRTRNEKPHVRVRELPLDIPDSTETNPAAMNPTAMRCSSGSWAPPSSDGLVDCGDSCASW